MLLPTLVVANFDYDLNGTVDMGATVFETSALGRMRSGRRLARAALILARTRTASGRIGTTASTDEHVLETFTHDSILATVGYQVDAREADSAPQTVAGAVIAPT
jgi:hypothetical protein